MILMKLTDEIISEIKKSIHPNVLKDKKAHKKFVNSYFPGAKAYGARNPEVRKIAKKYLSQLKRDEKLLLQVSKELWSNGYMEPRIVASVLIGYIIDRPEAIELVKKWVPSLDNWANCDLLMSETKDYWVENKEQTLDYSKKLIKSKNPWDRRFGLIMLIFPVRRGTISKKEALDIAYRLKDDKEKYVKKGYIWLLDQISKKGL